MNWRRLSRFRNPAAPKLDNLRRAEAAGLRVPPTVWRYAVDSKNLPAPPFAFPIILRSASPTEDGRTTSNAGQLLSLVVNQAGSFGDSLAQVVAALPTDAHDHPRGAVFAQPVIRGIEAGVVFFDGFHFERTRAARQNFELTAGQSRGEVERDQLRSGDPWSKWLRSVYSVFGHRDAVLDIEYARDEAGYVLLQCRPALFPVRRNPLLTLANHRETLGELPSPWTVSTMVAAGRDFEYLAAVEPEIGRWQETYSVEAAGRSWVNLSFFFRWLDHLGLPRSMALAAVGGDVVTNGRADHRVNWARLLRMAPRLSLQFLQAFGKIRRAPRSLAALDRQIETAQDLPGLRDVTIASWVLGVNTAMSIAGLMSFVLRLRTALHLPGSARLVTQSMMEEYDRLNALPDLPARLAGLDVWLQQHDHRGPFESDFARPRFRELKDILARDVASPAARSSVTKRPPSTVGRWLTTLTRPLFWIDEWREWFRDACMMRWLRIRQRLLAEGARLATDGKLSCPDDVFWLHVQDLDSDRTLLDSVAKRKELAELYQRLALPTTARLDEIERVVNATEAAVMPDESKRRFSGIALGHQVVEGIARKANDLRQLLSGDVAIDSKTILLVPTLEPSWAVVFSRVLGVVADIGGELSHASILLREACKPAIVNCTGIFRQVRDGERLRLDGARGFVERLDMSDGLV